MAIPLDSVNVYHSRLNFTAGQLNAFNQPDSLQHTQPVNCLHFPYDQSGSPVSENWALFRFALVKCNYACSGYLCLKGRSLLPGQLRRGLRSTPYSKSRPAIVGVRVGSLTSDKTIATVIQHCTLFSPDLHCAIQPPDVQLHRLIKFSSAETDVVAIGPIYIDMWFIFLPFKNNQLIRCSERPFGLGPLISRPVSTMKTLYEERDQTVDTDLSIPDSSSDDFDEPKTYLKAHKVILMASSEVFYKMLSPAGDFAESRTLTISLPPVSKNAAKLFVKFMYAGHFGKYQLFEDESQAFGEIFDLMSLGHYYGMEDLKNACEKALIYYIKRDAVPDDELMDQLFYALNTLAGSAMEISGVIYLSILLYGILKTPSIEIALDNSTNETLTEDLTKISNKAINMCQDGPAVCDYCRMIQNKLCTLRFTDMYV